MKFKHRVAGQDPCKIKLWPPLALSVSLVILSGCQSQPHQSTEATPAKTEQNAPNTADAKDPAVKLAAIPIVADNLWERAAQNFQLDLDQSHPRLTAEVNYYAKHPEYLKRISTRAQRYLYYILGEIEKRNMPGEIALLPIVESAYDPFAYSFGQASGLWQIIPSTATHLGLQKNWWYDGRRDVIASTQVALDYLQQYYQRFGDWELALAAYNSGGGTVSRAIRRNKKLGKPTDFWSLQLPKETRAYVPKLLAISKLVKNPAKYHIDLPELPNEPYFKVVSVDYQIDLAQAAKMADTPLNALYNLNPGFNRWATAPSGPHRLLVPFDKADTFKTALAEYPPEKRLQWERYTISKGDSLIAIAKKNHTTTALLQEVNHLQGHMIRAGHTLLIPKPSMHLANYKLTAEQRLLAKQRVGASTQNSKIIHTVRSGESLWSLSRKYKVTVSELARWNSMAPADIIKPNQKMVIWKNGGAKSSGTKLASANTVRKVNYRVKNGDSLYLIADRFNVAVSSIKKWNGDVANRRYLQPGQMLTLYVDVTRTYN